MKSLQGDQVVASSKRNQPERASFRLVFSHVFWNQILLEVQSGRLIVNCQSINGYPEYNPELFYYIPMWSKYAQIRQPPPSSLFVFIDENADTLEDAEFGSPPQGSPFFEQNVWWDMPSSRHDLGANLSFADGHVEHWKWQTPKVFYDWIQPVAAAEIPDYQRLQNAMKQPADN